ncbi:uncharacterized protein LOC134209330 isoform X2 [Armigeres subalbatus]|uniref:uncharacterized protein LOC134209330 isoform X2 n=1 Tax=Armigeres subalbatus TaxID=124917 RepID=UPI002ED2E26E
MKNHENCSEPSDDKNGGLVLLPGTSWANEMERSITETSGQEEKQNSITSCFGSAVEDQDGHSNDGDKSVSKFYRSDYPVTQINGCRQYGPPKNWVGPTPGFGCEIYVRRIPPEFTEANLVPLFERFGKIYEMRLMMDYSNNNRRYCFVRYTNEEDAKVAIEVLNHHFVQENQTLEAQKSFEKCRLFVGNLPKEIDRKTIEVAFRSLFPEMTRFVMHNRITDGEMNRGFAFMDFANHAAALRAKKQTTPGCMRMWERDIKIVWANPQQSLDHSRVDDVKIIFVRNIDQRVTTSDLYNLFVRMVPRQDIINITRVREFAFVEFALRQQAEMVMHVAQGYVLHKFALDIEWAMPPLRNTFHNMKNYDFDSLLRLKCVANEWDPPIIIYGRVFSFCALQYVAVLIRRHKQVHVYFLEMHITGLADIQSRVCEAIVTLILEKGVLPEPYLILKIRHDAMRLVGSVSSLSRPTLNLAQEVNDSLELFWTEIVVLCEAANEFVKYSFDDLFALYQQEIMTGFSFPYLDTIQLSDRLIGCLCQTFRCRSSFNRKLDCREIIFVLCDQYSMTNYCFSKKNDCNAEQISKMENVGTAAFKYKILTMLPNRIVQASRGQEPKINAVYFGLNAYALEAEYSINKYVPRTLFQGNPLTLNPNIPPPPPMPGTMQQMMPCMFNPVPVPQVFNGDVDHLSQALQQLGINCPSLATHAYYGPATIPQPPLFESAHYW